MLRRGREGKIKEVKRGRELNVDSEVYANTYVETV
jgi:hypothetical protein